MEDGRQEEVLRTNFTLGREISQVLTGIPVKLDCRQLFIS
jgi:hypothetical protein